MRAQTFVWPFHGCQWRWPNFPRPPTEFSLPPCLPRTFSRDVSLFVPVSSPRLSHNGRAPGCQVSRYHTLEEGDLLLTGTPEGVGACAPGDVLTAGFDQLPHLDITVPIVPALSLS